MGLLLWGRRGARLGPRTQLRLGSCDVLIAILGTHWLSCRDDEGQRRLDNPKDFVRVEIAAALRREIRVIPVLLDGAAMPRSGDLPDDLQLLVRRNTLPVSDTGFDDDCKRLVATIEQVFKQVETERPDREGKARLEAKRQAAEAKQRAEEERPATERSATTGAAIALAAGGPGPAARANWQRKVVANRRDNPVGGPGRRLGRLPVPPPTHHFLRSPFCNF